MTLPMISPACPDHLPLQSASILLNKLSTINRPSLSTAELTHGRLILPLKEFSN
jgi:hypothetical protein